MKDRFDSLVADAVAFKQREAFRRPLQAPVRRAVPPPEAPGPAPGQRWRMVRAVRNAVLAAICLCALAAVIGLACLLSHDMGRVQPVLLPAHASRQALTPTPSAMPTVWATPEQPRPRSAVVHQTIGPPPTGPNLAI